MTSDVLCGAMSLAMIAGVSGVLVRIIRHVLEQERRNQILYDMLNYRFNGFRKAGDLIVVMHAQARKPRAVVRFDNETLVAVEDTGHQKVIQWNSGLTPEAREKTLDILWAHRSSLIAPSVNGRLEMMPTPTAAVGDLMLASAATLRPIDMVIHCPACGEQHIDAPEPAKGWTNPPHKSHLCHACGVVWRAADVPTNGVRRTQTRGDDDTWSPT